MKYLFVIIIGLVFISGCIEGNVTKNRVDMLKEHLHTEGSGAEARRLFPDFEIVYTDPGSSKFPAEILPFTYYYSAEEDITVSICNIDYTVFVCEGKIDSLLEDYTGCEIADEYLNPVGY